MILIYLLLAFTHFLNGSQPAQGHGDTDALQTTLQNKCYALPRLPQRVSCSPARP